MSDLQYDGQTLRWKGYAFKATSGMRGLQEPKFQCTSDGGPIPEGRYRLLLKVDKDYAHEESGDVCGLLPARPMQYIQRGRAGDPCEEVWAAWGRHRVRLEPADATTRGQCAGRRSGFYIHDSTKGYSHGCIEVEGSFFKVYVAEVASQPSKNPRKWLILDVKYTPGRPTNGGTKA